MPQQLTLGFLAQAHFGREEFVRGPANVPAAEFLDRWPDWPSPIAILIGPEASGKSHLIAIRAATNGHAIRDARYLDWNALAAGLRTGELILIENLGEGIDEAGLFHLINAVVSASATLLLTARTPPAEWGLTLPDLVSRLRAATPVVIAEPGDDLLSAIMAKLFADRQTIVDPAVIGYCVTRMERSYVAARDIVADLDALSLARQSGVTRALAADVLASRGIPAQPDLPGLDLDPADETDEAKSP